MRIYLTRIFVVEHFPIQVRRAMSHEQGLVMQAEANKRYFYVTRYNLKNPMKMVLIRS